MDRQIVRHLSLEGTKTRLRATARHEPTRSYTLSPTEAKTQFRTAALRMEAAMWAERGPWHSTTLALVGGLVAGGMPER